MSLFSDLDLFITEFLTSTAGEIPECGVIVPAPLDFTDKADFLKSNAVISDTQRKIETYTVAMTVITMPKAPVRPDVHGGPWKYFYNFYLFREYDRKRLDQSQTPDEFRKKLAKNYQEFKDAIFALDAEFGEQFEISDPPEGVKRILIRLDDEADFIEENERCRYLSAVSGYGVDLPLTLNINFEEC